MVFRSLHFKAVWHCFDYCRMTLLSVNIVTIDWLCAVSLNDLCAMFILFIVSTFSDAAYKQKWTLTKTKISTKSTDTAPYWSVFIFLALSTSLTSTCLKIKQNTRHLQGGVCILLKGYTVLYFYIFFILCSMSLDKILTLQISKTIKKI